MTTKSISQRVFISFMILLLVVTNSAFIPALPPLVYGNITIWYSYDSGGAEEAALQAVLANAQAAFPSATITIVQHSFTNIFNDYRSAVQGGGGPDLLLTTNDWLGDMYRLGIIQNLDSLLAGRLDAFNASARDGIKVGGVLYGIPESAKAVALFYNKSTITSPPATTAELLTQVTAGKKIAIDSGSTGGSYYNYGFFPAFGGQLQDSTGRCIADQGGFVQAMEYLLSLTNAGAIIASDRSNDAVLPFEAGEIDYLIDGPWMLKDYESVLGTDLGLTLLPAGPVAGAAPFNGVDGFFANPNSTNLNSAVEVALYMVDQTNAQIFTDVGKHIPIRSDVTSTDPLINTFALASAQGFVRSQSPEFPAYWTPFNDLFTDVLIGTVTPAEGVKTACDTMDHLNHFLVADAVSIWYAYGEGGAEETAFLQILDDARLAFPELTINALRIDFNNIYSTYRAEVLAGGGPDMFIAPNDSLGDDVRLGVIQDIDSLLTGHLSAFYPSAVESMKVDGDLYGVPESAKAVGLFYNKSAVPTPPGTTAQLLAFIQAGKKFVLYKGAGVYFDFGLLNAFGGQLMDPSGRCIADRGGYVQMMEYLLSLKNAGAPLISDGWNEGIVPFMDGDIDMIFDGPWDLMNYENALGSNLGVAPLPSGPFGPSKPFNGIDGFYVNPNSPNQEAAVDIALFFTSQESSQIFTDVGGHVPIRTDVTSADPLINAFAAISTSGFPRPQSAQFFNYWTPFSNMFEQVLSGSVSPAHGIWNACYEMNQLNGFLYTYLYLPFIKR